MADLAHLTPEREVQKTISGARLLVPLVVASGLFMELLDSTVISTAIPKIAADFHLPPLFLNVAVTSYLLSLAVFIPISGWIADRFGARNVFCCAIFTFIMGSMFCGISQNLEELVAMRILQGLGGALMTPVGRLILVRSFAKSELVAAMNYVTIPALVGPALGPLVGGFFATYVSWRWIFFINVPVGICAILLAWRHTENFRATEQERFDFRGFVICGAGLALLELALEATGRNIVSGPVLGGAFAIAIMLCLLYGLHARAVKNPAVDLSLFRNKCFRVAILYGGILRIPMMTLSFLVPLQLEVGFGYSPMAAGAETLMVALGAMIVKGATKYTLRRFGFRRVLSINGVFVGLVIGMNALFTAATSPWIIGAVLLVGGFARSLQFTAINSLSFADLPSERLSKATSVTSICQQLTFSFGVAIATALLALTTAGKAITAPDFVWIFVIFGAIPIVTAPFFLSLSPSDGSAVSGNRASA